MNTVKQAQIKIGAWVERAFTRRQWPIKCSESIVFDIKDVGNGRFKCTAPGFGGDPYGNGALYAKRSDLIPWTKSQPQPHHTVLEEMKALREGFKAAICYLDPEMMPYLGIYPLRIGTDPKNHLATIRAIFKALDLIKEPILTNTETKKASF